MEISEIKQRLKIETALNHYGLQPDKNGILNCPFHKEDQASLKVYTDTNTFNCFGCGVNGDVIEFIQKKESCSKHEAIVRAKSLIGKLSPEKSGINSAKSRLVGTKESKENPVLSEVEGHTEILTKIFTSFKNGLKSSTAKHPQAYLISRSLRYEKLELGYNSGQFHHRGKLNEADKNACIAAGLLIPYTGKTPNGPGQTYTAFAKDCVIFPLKDRSGNIVSLYGRSITDNKSSRHFYLKNRSGLYPNYPHPNTTKLILTEAIIDAATLQMHNEELKINNEKPAILACYGTNGFTQEHEQAVKELKNLDEIIIFFDGDKSGKEATEQLSKRLRESSIINKQSKISFVETPLEEDVNSLLSGHDAEIFTHLLENRKPSRASLRNVPFSLTEKSKPEPIKTAAKLNTRNPEFITFTTEELQIVLLGGINLSQLDRLRATIKITRKGSTNPLHSIRHTIDLYHSDYLEKFINKASEQLETGTTILRMALAELIDQIEKYRLNQIESRKEKRPQERKLSQQQEQRAINYLKSPKLMERTNQDIGKTGMVGEENNRLLMYLVFTSRLREQPLHIISLGASGTGKTYLQERVSELIPEHHKLEITILSENAFYYFGQQELKHKLVLIEDMDGAENVLYPLRELQSKKKISKTIPIKDSKGNLKTITLKVEGPICLAGTTTREKLYEDNANRSLLIYLDSSKNHKEQIMKYQRKLSAGKIATKEEQQLIEFFKDMQTILKPTCPDSGGIKVRNPFAEYLVIPEHVFKPLRTNSHYLAFIETITFYHQYQREVKTDSATNERYIETTLEDIEWANRLLKDVLLAKADELSGECRRLFERLKNWLKANNKTSFYKNEIREAFRMNPNNLKYYLVQLLRYNYLKVVGGNRHKSGFEYEIRNIDEYSQLNKSLDNALDAALEDIRKSMVGSADNRRVTDAVIHSTT